jgi:hypothetical protein
MERMDNEQGRKFGTAGPLVKIEWNDAAAQIKIHVINGNEPEEHLAKCVTVGELIVKDRKALILCQHWSDTDGIDILAIPTDWVTKITVLEEVGTAIEESEVNKCTIENLESQQESGKPKQQKKSKAT